MIPIINNSYFAKENGLYIPLSIAQPCGYDSSMTPNSEDSLNSLCAKIEKELLINAIGISLFNQLQAALADINNPSNAIWKNLVYGEEYDDKVWIGLNDEYSFIAYRVYEQYRTFTETQTTAIGEAKVNAENSSNVTAAYKIAEANQQFLKGYQGGYSHFPNFYIRRGVEFIDYYHDHNVYVPFRNYLIDKQADFVGLDMNKFKIYYNDKNSFGI